ncbi:FkbM family methyltransferase [Rhodophyticola sp. CCM32]|uniref:FkbM family methyltransferase n=1 Tax=Rhodophyticola sp. CCM32 TaxID=2916397 RepID=UPI00107F72B8|nr:FkbM family methyltransferase [Rhodophyticola sp. CCM32]QBY00409.1 FkbM family methyltransferase [Rhodophyticola sp. CCM32]
MTKAAVKASTVPEAPFSDTSGLIDRHLQNDKLHPVVAKALGRLARFMTPRGTRVVLSHRYDRPVFFTFNNPDDRIHKNHMRGRFYESEQLAEIAGHMRKNGTYLDVGANVGNHTMYMLMFGGAAKVIPVEPNPEAIPLLTSNLILNGLMDRVDLTALGYGLDADSEDGLHIDNPRGNLGWARLKRQTGEAGAISVRRGDDLVGKTRIDMIKMDVEGMEIGALQGLRETIARCRPKIFIEVDHRNREVFDALMDEWGYEKVTEFSSSKVNQNLLMKPKPKPRLKSKRKPK